MAKEPCNNTSTGVVVVQGFDILLVERLNKPHGLAPPSGHVNSEDQEDISVDILQDEMAFRCAAVRELEEEVSLIADAKHLQLLYEGRYDLACSRPQGSWHYWRVFLLRKFEGTPQVPEAEREKIGRVGWFSTRQINEMMERTFRLKNGAMTPEDWEKLAGLEEVWCHMFGSLGFGK